MSIFTYNGITLPYPYHTNFSQEIIYDNMGDAPTDKCYTQFQISLNSVLNINYLPTMGLAADAVSTPTAIMVKIRAALLQPRRTLSVTVGGVDLIGGTIATNRGYVDARNGPLPQYCRITQLTNETFLIQYSIIAHYWLNTKFVNGVPLNQTAGSVLSNRWSEVVEIDDLLLSTKVRSGKIVIRSDNPDGDIAQDLIISAAVTGVEQGFMRMKSKYTVSPDGLNLAYEITDREVYKMPPVLVTDASVKASTKTAYRAAGTYKEGTTPGDGGQCGWNRVGVASVQLWGAKTTSQASLIATAMSICNAKLVFNNTNGLGVNSVTVNEDYQGRGNKTGNIRIMLLTKFELTVDMYNNTVSVMMAARMKPKTKGNINVNIDRGNMTGKLLGWTWTPRSEKGGTQPLYAAKGTANLTLKAAAYYDAGVADAFLKNGIYGTGLQVGKAGVQTEDPTEAELNAEVGLT